MESSTKSSVFNAKVIVFSAVAIALATFLATYIKFDGPFWVNGGSVTLFSMLIICMVGYWYGPKIGITAAVAFGILQFITNPYFVHPIQVLLDYPLAFGALGLSGFFCNKKNGLIKGYIVGVLGRLIFHCVSGVIFYTSYVGDFKGNALAIWAGILYNMSYIIPEAVATLVVIALPPVKKALAEVKRLAVS